MLHCGKLLWNLGYILYGHMTTYGDKKKQNIRYVHLCTLRHSMEIYWDEKEKTWEKQNPYELISKSTIWACRFWPFNGEYNDQLQNFEVPYFEINPYTITDPWWRCCTTMPMGENRWHFGEHRNIAACSSPHLYAIHVNYRFNKPSRSEALLDLSIKYMVTPWRHKLGRRFPHHFLRFEHLVPRFIPWLKYTKLFRKI